MKSFDVWVEGYAATGEHGYAQLMGTFEADSFTEACRQASESGKYGKFDPERLTVWGCQMFDNESDARVSYG